MVVRFTAMWIVAGSSVEGHSKVIQNKGVVMSMGFEVDEARGAGARPALVASFDGAVSSSGKAQSVMKGLRASLAGGVSLSG
jgi:hypothetical protein